MRVVLVVSPPYGEERYTRRKQKNTKMFWGLFGSFWELFGCAWELFALFWVLF